MEEDTEVVVEATQMGTMTIREAIPVLLREVETILQPIPAGMITLV